jgi:methionyl-tRNA formyltransferase
MQLQPSEVKQVASRYNLPVWQPAKVSTPEFLDIFHELKPSLVVVVAFGQKIPASILFEPEFGCINVHGSLLPKYRGAAPIQWSILNGDATAGVTTMYMDEGWDTGDMIYQAVTDVAPDETFSGLYGRLAKLGADLLVKTVRDILAHTAPRIPQDSSLATVAPKLPSEMQRMDWGLNPETIHNRIRVHSDISGIETYLNGERLKISETRIKTESSVETAEPGKIIAVIKQKGILVGTGAGPILVTKVQPAGKQVMNATDYANGKRLQAGMFFTQNA